MQVLTVANIIHLGYSQGAIFRRNIILFKGVMVMGKKFVCTVLILVALAFSFNGCGAATPEASGPPTPALIPTPPPGPEPQYPSVISPQQAEEMMAQTGVMLLDVRTQEEFDNGHIEGAVLLPYNQIENLAPTMLPDKAQTILIYCQSGRRSNIAAWALAGMGYSAVYDFSGIQNWHGPIVGPRNIFYNYFGVLPEGTDVPFTFTMSEQITPYGPELEFVLHGYELRNYMRNFDRTHFWAWHEYSVHTIYVNHIGGTPLQEITGLETRQSIMSEPQNFGLFFDDFNFDGYMDMTLFAFPGGTMRNAPSYFWLWCNELEQFVLCDFLTELSWGASIGANHELNIITTFTRGGPSHHYLGEYEYRNDEFVAIRYIIQEFVWRDDDDDEDAWEGWRITERDPATGVETVTYTDEI